MARLIPKDEVVDHIWDFILLMENKGCQKGQMIPVRLTGVWIALISDAVICFFLARIRWQRGKWALIQV